MKNRFSTDPTGKHTGKWLLSILRRFYTEISPDLFKIWPDFVEIYRDLFKIWPDLVEIRQDLFKIR